MQPYPSAEHNRTMFHAVSEVFLVVCPGSSTQEFYFVPFDFYTGNSKGQLYTLFTFLVPLPIL